MNYERFKQLWGQFIPPAATVAGPLTELEQALLAASRGDFTAFNLAEEQLARLRRLPPVEGRIAQRLLAEAPQTVLGFAGPVVIERIVREELRL